MLADVVDLVLPRTCAGCGVSGDQCCGQCHSILAHLSPRPAAPSPAPVGMPPTWAAAAYSGVLAHIIVAWKDQDRGDLRGVLGSLLCRVLGAAIDDSPLWRAAVAKAGTVAVVAVPSRAHSTRARGRFPVGDLVDHLVHAQRGPRPLMQRRDALGFGRAVADQAGLGQTQRSDNVSGAMCLRHSVSMKLVGVPIVLVDDITTTGNTLAEASSTLHASGSGPVIAITVAATARRWSGTAKS